MVDLFHDKQSDNASLTDKDKSIVGDECEKGSDEDNENDSNKEFNKLGKKPVDECGYENDDEDDVHYEDDYYDYAAYEDGLVDAHKKDAEGEDVDYLGEKSVDESSATKSEDND